MDYKNKIGEGKIADIIIRTGCNLNCNQCFAGGCKKGDYDIEKASELRDDYMNKGYNVYAYPTELTFLYGTPEFKRVLEFYKICNKDRLLTNGVLIGKNPEILDSLSEYGIKELSIGNFEGLDIETQNALTGQGETLIYTLKGIKNAVAKGFKVGVYSVLNKANIIQAQEMCKLANKLGADSIKFFRLVPIGKAKELSDLLLSTEEIEGFIVDIFRTMRPENKNLNISLGCNFGPDMYSKKTDEYIEKEGRVCFPTNPSYIAMEPLKNGIIYYNCFFGMAEPKLIRTDLTEKFDINKLKGMCGECDLKEKCGGGCRTLAYALTGDFYGSMDVCRTKVIEKYGLRSVIKNG